MWSSLSGPVSGQMVDYMEITVFSSQLKKFVNEKSCGAGKSCLDSCTKVKELAQLYC